MNAPSLVILRRASPDWSGFTDLDHYFRYLESFPYPWFLHHREKTFRDNLTFWNRRFSLTFWEYRQRVKEVADRSLKATGLPVYDWSQRDRLCRSEHTVIPIDDDDWLSPAISSLDFCGPGFAAWRTPTYDAFNGTFWGDSHASPRSCSYCFVDQPVKYARDHSTIKFDRPGITLIDRPFSLYVRHPGSTYWLSRNTLPPLCSKGPFPRRLATVPTGYEWARPYIEALNQITKDLLANEHLTSPLAQPDSL